MLTSFACISFSFSFASVMFEITRLGKKETICKFRKYFGFHFLLNLNRLSFKQRRSSSLLLKAISRIQETQRKSENSVIGSGITNFRRLFFKRSFSFRELSCPQIIPEFFRYDVLHIHQQVWKYPPIIVNPGLSRPIGLTDFRVRVRVRVRPIFIFFIFKFSNRKCNLKAQSIRNSCFQGVLKL